MNNYKLYCLTNITNDKKYIGITRQDINKKWQNGKGYKKPTRIGSAINKYGWNNFKKEILFENLSTKEANALEKEYIIKFDTINNGYNVQSGGLNNNDGIVSKVTREKLSISHKGQHSSPRTEFKKGKRSKAHLKLIVPVYCVELNKAFDSIITAERELNISHHIWDCLKGRRNKCGGYHWILIGGNE